jgi:hypothetical protein
LGGVGPLKREKCKEAAKRLEPAGDWLAVRSFSLSMRSMRFVEREEMLSGSSASKTNLTNGKGDDDVPKH